MVSLQSFQDGLAGSVMSGRPGPLPETPGLRLTRSIRRTWCRGRVAVGAQLTLAALPQARAAALLDEWVDLGGGSGTFFAAEAEAFLEFAASRLDDPSHALSICRFECAVVRAGTAAAWFTPAEFVAGTPLTRGRYASLVTFAGRPADLLSAIEHRAVLPPPSRRQRFLLLAPGIPGFWRAASGTERRIMEQLAVNPYLSELATIGIGTDLARRFLAEGVIEPANAG